MNYVISSCDCTLFGANVFELKANVKYKMKEDKGCSGIVFSNGSIPFLFKPENTDSVLKVECGFDKYYFLFPKCVNAIFLTRFKFRAAEIEIALSNKLVITVSGVLICEKNVENLNFSHYEIYGNFCLIFFRGPRNYLVALKGEELVFANYYDECNIGENEKYFLCKLNDSLNHGVVCKLNEKLEDVYLVYLDNEELLLKNEFVAHVFLDCVLAENFKYCNSLLCEELKLKDEKQIKEFFPDFDYYYPVNATTFILINKNALAGIIDFRIENVLITNIKVR